MKQKKEWAKMLYLKEHLTQAEVAERVGVSKQTLCKWVKTEKWEELKASVSLTREEQLANLYRQVAEINKAIAGREEGERFATSKEADTINKLAAAIEKMEKETGHRRHYQRFQRHPRLDTQDGHGKGEGTQLLF